MEWLRDLVNRLLSIFPRILILGPHEAGVRITGKKTKKLGAGCWIYWPIVQKIIWMEIPTQVADLRAQSVRTSDGISIVVSGAIQYSVKDIKKAALDVQDVDKSLETLALGIIFDFVHSRRLEDCRDIKILKAEILRGIKDAAAGWGLKIEKVYITDLDKTRNIRLLLNKGVLGGMSNGV